MDPAPETVRLCGSLGGSIGGTDVGSALKGSRLQLAYAYLVLNRARPVSRQALIAAAWPERRPEDPRAALRTLLSRLRSALGPDFVAGGEELHVNLPPHAVVDLDDARAALERAEQALRAAGWDEAADAARVTVRIAHRGFLSGLEADWVDDQRAAVKQMEIEALEILARGALAMGGRNLVDAERAARTLLELEPLREGGYRLLIEVLAARGEVAQALQVYETCRRVLRHELAIAPSPELIALHRRLLELRAADDTPRTRYALAGEAHIAYQVFGDGPEDLLLVPGFVSHVEETWDHPNSAAFLAGLAEHARVIVFDKRGTGLSDPTDSLPTVDQRLEDILAVLEAARSERPTIMGTSEGAAYAITFAARYPERVARLVLYGGFARYTRLPDYPYGLSRDEVEGLAGVIEERWGEGRMLSFFAADSADEPGVRDFLARYERLGASPRMAMELVRGLNDVDVRDDLERVVAPTLVLHRRDDPMVAVGSARYLARSIQGARLVELSGRDHIWAFGDSQQILDAVVTFMASAVTDDRTGWSRAADRLSPSMGPASRRTRS